MTGISSVMLSAASGMATAIARLDASAQKVATMGAPRAIPVKPGGASVANLPLPESDPGIDVVEQMRAIAQFKASVAAMQAASRAMRQAIDRRA